MTATMRTVDLGFSASLPSPETEWYVRAPSTSRMHLAWPEEKVQHSTELDTTPPRGTTGPSARSSVRTTRS